MSTFFVVLTMASALVLLVPTLVFLIEIVAARDVTRIADDRPAGPLPRMTVLIPAHDESVGILDTLASVTAQLGAADRCLVVADNCTDDTARVARDAGVDVIERDDAGRRGKGYALDFGLRALASDPPDVVVIVDADCLLAPATLERVASLSHRAGRPVQALYLMTGAGVTNRGAAVAEFAWRVKNWARPLGLKRLGLPCQLMGSGMAFPWDVLKSARLATGNLVEDMQLGIDLATAGHAPLFCPDARVTSAFPNNAAGAKSQRVRWEHGHLATLLGTAPGLILHGLRRRDRACVAMGLDLLVPPLALLLLLLIGNLVICALVAMSGASVRPLEIAAVGLAAWTIAVWMAWRRFGRQLVTPRMLVSALFYTVGKVPVYAAFLFRRQADWVRSKRDVE